MAIRQSISKKTRFEIFKRDGFECQYCGRTPPGVVLVVDHIIPVRAGGTSAEMNLISACEDCNQGKGDRLIGDLCPHPDADLKYLAAMQESAELRRFREAEIILDRERKMMVDIMRNKWVDISGLSWSPDDSVFLQWLARYSPETIGKVIESVAPKIADGRVSKYRWEPYFWGALRARTEEHG